MTLTVPFTEPTTKLRDWLRGLAAVQSVAAQRVYAGGLPKTPTLPAVTIRRIGGGLDGPVDLGLYQIDCWATTAPDASAVASVVGAQVESVGLTDLTGVSLCGGTVQSVNYIDTTTPDLYRYSLTVQLVTRTST